jgi:hypothetical protein
MDDFPAKESLDRLQTDQPIEKRGDDDLGRLPFVDLLTEEVRNAPTADGFVMALTGPWGEGKTSVLNLVADALQNEVVIVRFNPWLFTDAQALVLRFFAELGAQVGRHSSLRNVGKRLASYGKAVAPFGSLLIGPAADLIAKSLSAIESPVHSPDQEREELKEELRTRKKRILVLIDDIDRLHTDEILDVMRLVKLVGDLPFVTYLLAFDRPYVEKALCREQAEGRSYLEKVVQVSFDLPRIRRYELERLLLGRLNVLVTGVPHLPVRQERWEEILGRGLMPFFRNLRDVVRYSSSVKPTLRLIEKDIALEDVFALEALRVFEPQVHQELPRLVPALTKQRSDIFIDQEAEEKKEREVLTESLDRLTADRRMKVNALLRLIFPRAGDALGGAAYQADNWRAHRQVAHGSVLRTYLHASVDPDLASYRLVEEALAALGDPVSFQAVLQDVSSEVLGDFLSQVPDFSGQIAPDVVQVGVAELLKLESRLSRERDPFRPVPHFYLKNAIRAVLSALPSIGERQNGLMNVFDSAPTESERFNLIYWFGTFPDKEEKRPEFEILSEKQTKQLQVDLNARSREMGPIALREEPMFHWLIFDAFQGDQYRDELEKSIDNVTLVILLQRFVTLSLNRNEMYFNLDRAEQLFSRDFLLERLHQLNEDAAQSDLDTLSLLKAALDNSSPGES